MKLLSVCAALALMGAHVPKALAQAPTSGRGRIAVTVVAQVYEIPRRDMLVPQVEDPKADAQAMLRKVANLAGGSSVRFTGFPVVTTKSGTRASARLGDMALSANEVGFFELLAEPVVAADGESLSLVASVVHGKASMKFTRNLRFGEMVYAGKLDDAAKKDTVELVFLQVVRQFSKDGVPQQAAPAPSPKEAPK